MSYDLVGDDYEIIGDDGGDDLGDLLGDDDDGDEDGGAELVGGTHVLPVLRGRVTRRGRKVQGARIVAERAARQGLVVAQKKFRASRKLPFGFASTGTIAAGDSQSITIRFPSPTKPLRLMIPDVYAGKFALTKLASGYDSFLPSADGIPCDVFSPQATAIDVDGTGFLKMPTIQTGGELVMTFENLTDAAAKLRGTWIIAAVT